MMPDVMLPHKYGRKSAKAFNLYEIAALFDRMRSPSYRRATIGLLDKAAGCCHYIGHVDDLSKLVEIQVDLQNVVFIPNNGYAQGGRLWTAEHFSKELVETIVCEYIPQLLPLFQSLEYPFSERAEQTFDEALWKMEDSENKCKISQFGFFAFADVYIWCQEQKILLIPPIEAYEKLIVSNRGQDRGQIGVSLDRGQPEI